MPLISLCLTNFRFVTSAFKDFLPDSIRKNPVIAYRESSAPTKMILISDADIAGLNIPTGIPLLYTLDANGVPTKKGGEYLDPEAAKAAIEAVANQGKK